MTERKLRLTRNDPSKDPMIRGVWIGAPGHPTSLPELPTLPEPLELPPEPPIDPQNEKWKAIVEIADPVIALVRNENGDVDYQLLLAVVRDIVTNNLDVDDIAAIYRHRVKDKPDA